MRIAHLAGCRQQCMPAQRIMGHCPIAYTPYVAVCLHWARRHRKAIDARSRPRQRDCHVVVVEPPPPEGIISGQPHEHGPSLREPFAARSNRAREGEREDARASGSDLRHHPCHCLRI